MNKDSDIKIDIKMTPIFTDNENNIVLGPFNNSIGHHPIIIFYNEFNEEYYYVKCRSAYEKNSGEKKDQRLGEIFVPKAKRGLLTNDSYVDTTKIYHIKKEELEQFTNKKAISSTKELDPIIGMRIYDQIADNLEQKPPFCIVMKVSYNQKLKKFESYTEYSDKKLLEKEFKNLKDKKHYYFSLKEEILNNKSEKNQKSLGICEGILNNTIGESIYYYEKYFQDNPFEYITQFNSYDEYKKAVVQEQNEKNNFQNEVKEHIKKGLNKSIKDKKPER